MKNADKLLCVSTKVHKSRCHRCSIIVTPQCIFFCRDYKCLWHCVDVSPEVELSNNTALTLIVENNEQGDLLLLLWLMLPAPTLHCLCLCIRIFLNCCMESSNLSIIKSASGAYQVASCYCLFVKKGKFVWSRQ